MYLDVEDAADAVLVTFDLVSYLLDKVLKVFDLMSDAFGFVVWARVVCHAY